MGILPKPCLALITNSAKYGEIDLDLIDSAVTGGVDIIQLREPKFTAQKIVKIGNLIKEITQNRALFFLNGNPKLANKIKADGVHLPERKLYLLASDIPRGLIIGRSIHSKKTAIEAKKAGSDLLIAGSIFKTDSHPGTNPSGLKLIEIISKSVGMPILGIGGITVNNVGSVIKAGADGVAVISSIWNNGKPEIAAYLLKNTMMGN